MIKVERFTVMGIGPAVRGMRNPLESWADSDSFELPDGCVIGEKDMNLAMKLIRAGSDHCKFLRQIFVSIDIVAPMSWWWDFDTYKVATVKNSTSRMHKLGTRLLTPDDFSWDDENGVIVVTPLRQYTLNDLNKRISLFQKLRSEGKHKEATYLWRDIVLDLPDSYNFMSTWSGNYQNLRNVYHSRKNHKQREFRDFCRFLLSLPYRAFIEVER